MGRVIDLEEWRRGRGLPTGPIAPAAEPSPADRLEELLTRLDPLVRAYAARGSRRVETELLAMIVAVNSGMLDEAIARAERLAARLEHPSARAAR